MNSHQRRKDYRHKSLIEAGRNATVTLYSFEQRILLLEAQITDLKDRAVSLTRALDNAQTSRAESELSVRLLKIKEHEFIRRLDEREKEIRELLAASLDKDKQALDLMLQVKGATAELEVLRGENVLKLRRRLAEKTKEIEQRDRQIQELRDQAATARRLNHASLEIKR